MLSYVYAKNTESKEETAMTALQIMAKRDRIERQMYKAIEKGDYDKADRLRKQIVDLDVQSLAMRNR